MQSEIDEINIIKCEFLNNVPIRFKALVQKCSWDYFAHMPFINNLRVLRNHK